MREFESYDWVLVLALAAFLAAAVGVIASIIFIWGMIV